MYNAHFTADRIKKALIDKHITGKKMSEDLHLGVNTMSNIRRGDVKSIETFYLIADYLECSVDYLLGRAEKQQIAPTETDESDSNKQRLLHNYDDMNESAQEHLADYSDFMVSNETNLKSDIQNNKMNA